VGLGCSRKHVADGLGVPLTTAWRADAACVESVRYLIERRSARALPVEITIIDAIKEPAGVGSETK
jgi:hypothetical protein